MVSKDGKRKVTLIASDESPDEIRRFVHGHEFVDEIAEVELVIRQADGREIEEEAVAARLCGCRRVCLAFIEPD